MKPASPAPFQVTPKAPYGGPSVLTLDAGAGSARAIEVAGGKVKLPDGLEIKETAPYLAGDDYSGIAMLTGSGHGVSVKGLRTSGLHVAVRGCQGYDQSICLKDPIIDGADKGRKQEWVFGILTAQHGPVIVDGGVFTRGGSLTNPNKSHRLYLAPETPLALTNSVFRLNHAGRDVQIYGGDGSKKPPPYWHIGGCTFERLLLKPPAFGSYASVQTNPLVRSVIEDTVIANDYCCVEAHGDVLIKGGSLDGEGAGVRAMHEGITIELRGVVNACEVPVDTQGLKGVKVVRS